ncbi:hypothetical protein BKA70DRAFT_608215 [Coprinopsis sp. MPI-PUGE-AT-0042]|nr:hypothetical protein BKA70DRAFT_608215 [Coprinopsis sp. MPI-PUGE-AT-0042]
MLVGAGKPLSSSSGGTPEIQVIQHSYGPRGEVIACIVKFLLVHRGIQVNLVDNGKSSALVKAAIWGHKGVAKLLLVQSEIQAKATKALPNCCSATALSTSVQSIRMETHQPRWQRKLGTLLADTPRRRLNGPTAIAKLLQDFEFQRAFITRHP